MSGNLSKEAEAELAEFIAQFHNDPLGLIMAIFPWGEPTLLDGSFNPLHDKEGPEPWQREELIALGEHMKRNQELREMGLDMEVYRLAVGSGHGVGKSAFVAWFIYIIMSTRVDTRMVITASTQFQLEDKTWPELAKWHNLALNRHWFLWSATTFSFAAYPEERRKNYRATAATVGKDNTEAFAGLHNEGRAIAVVFDEASGVDPKIWEVADGALTDGEAFMLATGNMTKPDGPFVDCFDKHGDLYRTRHVDTREVSFTNINAINDIIRKYGGEDADEVKVRVRGLPPSQSYNGFIQADAVKLAMEAEVEPDHGAALIMAVDVARMGGDKTVIGYRQGRDARSIPQKVFQKMPTTRTTEVVAREAEITRPDAIVIESVGPGSGVIDQLRDLGFKVIEVHPGAPCIDPEHYANKRAWYWGRMRDWLYDENPAIPNDHEMYEEMTLIQYTFDRHEQRILLERKDDLKTRIKRSPDKTDTLALTFAVTIPRRDRNLSRRATQGKRAKMDYDPLDY